MGDVRGPLLERAQVGTWLVVGVRVRVKTGEGGAAVDEQQVLDDPLNHQLSNARPLCHKAPARGHDVGQAAATVVPQREERVGEDVLALQLPQFRSRCYTDPALTA